MLSAHSFLLFAQDGPSFSYDEKQFIKYSQLLKRVDSEYLPGLMDDVVARGEPFHEHFEKEQRIIKYLMAVPGYKELIKKDREDLLRLEITPNKTESFKVLVLSSSQKEQFVVQNKEVFAQLNFLYNLSSLNTNKNKKSFNGLSTGLLTSLDSSSEKSRGFSLQGEERLRYLEKLLMGRELPSKFKYQRQGYTTAPSSGEVLAELSTLYEIELLEQKTLTDYFFNHWDPDKPITKENLLKFFDLFEDKSKQEFCVDITYKHLKRNGAVEEEIQKTVKMKSIVLEEFPRWVAPFRGYCGTDCSAKSIAYLYAPDERFFVIKDAKGIKGYLNGSLVKNKQNGKLGFYTNTINGRRVSQDDVRFILRGLQEKLGDIDGAQELYLRDNSLYGAINSKSTREVWREIAKGQNLTEFVYRNPEIRKEVDQAFLNQAEKADLNTTYDFVSNNKNGTLLVKKVGLDSNITLETSTSLYPRPKLHPEEMSLKNVLGLLLNTERELDRETEELLKPGGLLRFNEWKKVFAENVEKWGVTDVHSLAIENMPRFLELYTEFWFEFDEKMRKQVAKAVLDNLKVMSFEHARIYSVELISFLNVSKSQIFNSLYKETLKNLEFNPYAGGDGREAFNKDVELLKIFHASNIAGEDDYFELIKRLSDPDEGSRALYFNQIGLHTLTKDQAMELIKSDNKYLRLIGVLSAGSQGGFVLPKTTNPFNLIKDCLTDDECIRYGDLYKLIPKNRFFLDEEGFQKNSRLIMSFLKKFEEHYSERVAMEFAMYFAPFEFPENSKYSSDNLGVFLHDLMYSIDVNNNGDAGNSLFRIMRDLPSDVLFSREHNYFYLIVDHFFSLGEYVLADSAAIDRLVQMLMRIDPHKINKIWSLFLMNYLDYDEDKFYQYIKGNDDLYGILIEKEVAEHIASKNSRQLNNFMREVRLKVLGWSSMTSSSEKSEFTQVELFIKGLSIFNVGTISSRFKVDNFSEEDLRKVIKTAPVEFFSWLQKSNQPSKKLARIIEGFLPEVHNADIAEFGWRYYIETKGARKAFEFWKSLFESGYPLRFMSDEKRKTVITRSLFQLLEMTESSNDKLVIEIIKFVIDEFVVNWTPSTEIISHLHEFDKWGVMEQVFEHYLKDKHYPIGKKVYWIYLSLPRKLNSALVNKVFTDADEQFLMLNKHQRTILEISKRGYGVKSDISLGQLRRSLSNVSEQLTLFLTEVHYGRMSEREVVNWLKAQPLEEMKTLLKILKKHGAYSSDLINHWLKKMKSSRVLLSIEIFEYLGSINRSGARTRLKGLINDYWFSIQSYPLRDQERIGFWIEKYQQKDCRSILTKWSDLH